MIQKKKTKTKTTRTATQTKSDGQKPIRAITEKQTKTQILKDIAASTGLSIQAVKSVLLAASHLAKCHLTKKGSGEFAVPEMGIKLIRKTRPATKKRQGRNPLTGESITIPAKPKSEVIRVRPLKALKDILE
jgi:nucleoid DNA-binding protein